MTTPYADLRIYPSADLLPLISGAEFDDLVDGIQAFGGLREPIVFTQDLHLLDGRNRYRACEVAGIEPAWRYFGEDPGDGDDPDEFVIAKNLQRRDLTDSQRAIFWAAYATLPAHRPANNPELVPGSALTQAQVAARADVTDRTIRNAVVVLRDGTPELVDAVRQGHIPVTPAAQLAREPVEAQQEAAANGWRFPSSGNNEWFTPREYIESARKVMGSIDLDPASCPAANEVVGARTFYTKDDDGLDRPWLGNVWMNPPYAASLIRAFVDRITDGQPTQAIALTHCNTETGWCQDLLAAASAVCFVKGRIRFWNPENGTSASGLTGNLFTYIGPYPELFVAEFSQYGHCMIQQPSLDGEVAGFRKELDDLPVGTG
jgi:ParB-like chromosome segregation protein Spo0J